MNASVKHVLFVCVENSNRSQMAEAFARMLGGNTVQAYSAGSRPSGVVNPKAIAAMRELGYDLSTHGSKSLQELPDVEFDFVATMGCGDECPFIKARNREDWSFPDPKHLSPDEYRNVRDQIREKVRSVLKGINVSVLYDFPAYGSKPLQERPDVELSFMAREMALLDLELFAMP